MSYTFRKNISVDTVEFSRISEKNLIQLYSEERSSPEDRA